MAMHGAALKRVQEKLAAIESFGKGTTGASLRGERLPSNIERGQFVGDLPSASDVLYVVYSYVTPIAWVLNSGALVVPDVTYSATTTHHQHVCRCYLPQKCKSCGVWNNVFGKEHEYDCPELEVNK